MRLSSSRVLSSSQLKITHKRGKVRRMRMRVCVEFEMAETGQ